MFSGMVAENIMTCFKRGVDMKIFWMSARMSEPQVAGEPTQTTQAMRERPTLVTSSPGAQDGPGTQRPFPQNLDKLRTQPFQHLVAFVQDEELDFGQVQAVWAAGKILHAPGRAHDNVGLLSLNEFQVLLDGDA
jgi:hypothetical protein